MFKTDIEKFLGRNIHHDTIFVLKKIVLFADVMSCENFYSCNVNGRMQKIYVNNLVFTPENFKLEVSETKERCKLVNCNIKFLRNTEYCICPDGSFETNDVTICLRKIMNQYIDQCPLVIAIHSFERYYYLHFGDILPEDFNVNIKIKAGFYYVAEGKIFFDIGSGHKNYHKIYIKNFTKKNFYNGRIILNIDQVTKIKKLEGPESAECRVTYFFKQLKKISNDINYSSPNSEIEKDDNIIENKLGFLRKDIVKEPYELDILFYKNTTMENFSKSISNIKELSLFKESLKIREFEVSAVFKSNVKIMGLYYPNEDRDLLKRFADFYFKFEGNQDNTYIIYNDNDFEIVGNIDTSSFSFLKCEYL